MTFINCNNYILLLWCIYIKHMLSHKMYCLSDMYIYQGCYHGYHIDFEIWLWYMYIQVRSTLSSVYSLYIYNKITLLMIKPHKIVIFGLGFRMPIIVCSTSKNLNLLRQNYLKLQLKLPHCFVLLDLRIFHFHIYNYIIFAKLK